MLILTRRIGETLMVGDDVTVTVLGVKVTKCASASTHRKMFLCTAKKFISASSRKNKAVALAATANLPTMMTITATTITAIANHFTEHCAGCFAVKK